ncbi:hypothetical protein [Halocatena halophila]|uniref:hypothetical protein n=1 Tax=Halocatena halophila TaxID=2814576 RepID=UPI002ED1DC19
MSKADKNTIKITYTGEERKSWSLHNKSIWRTPDQAGWSGDFDDLTLDEVKRLQSEIQGLEDSDDKGVYEDEIKPYLKSRETDGTLQMKSHNKSVPMTVTMYNRDYFTVSYEEKSWRIPWNEISIEWGLFAEPGVQRDKGIRDLLPNERGQLRKEILRTEEYQYQIEDHITKDVGGDLSEVNQEEKVEGSDSGMMNVRGPVESFKDILEYVGNEFAKGVGGFVDSFHWVMLTVPAPGDVTEPTTWFPQNQLGVSGTNTQAEIPSNQSDGNQTQQSNETANESLNVGARDERRPPDEMQSGSWWPVVWGIYGGFTGLVGLPIAVSGIYAWSNTSSPREKDKRLKRVGVMIVMIVGGVVFIPLILHLVNSLALGIVPNGGEFLKTPGDFTKLGLGLVLGVALVLLEGGLIIIGLIVLFIQWVLMYFVVAVWPLAAVCLGSNNRYLKPYGHTIFSIFAGLLILKLIQAIWLRFIYELPLSFGNPGSSLLTLGTITVGVLLAFIHLPLYSVRNLLPQVVTTLGQNSASMGHRRRRTWHHQPQYYDDHHQSLHRGEWHNGSRNYRTRSTQVIDSNGSWRDSSSQGGQQTILTDYTIDSEQPEYPRRVRAVEWLGQNVKKGIEYRRSAKSHWEGAKWYWSGMLPGNRYRGRLKPVRPLRDRMRGRVNQASDWWKDWKQRYETDNEKDSNE